MENEIRISKEFLEKTLNNNARFLVGIIMKRFETFADANVVKKSVKELIYESSRTLKSTLESFSSGVKFTAKPKDDEKS